jgi:hypothetical protein
MSMIFDLLPLLAIILVSFACGYALREHIARRRRDAARKKFHEEHPQFGSP